MLITTWYQHLQVHIKNTTEVRKYKFSSAFRKVWKQAFNTYVYQYFGRTESDFNSKNINLQINYYDFKDNKSYPRPAWRPWRHSESSAWPQTSGPSHLNSKVPVRNESISQAMLLIAYGSRSIPPVASSVLVVKSSQNCGVLSTVSTWTLAPPWYSSKIDNHPGPLGIISSSVVDPDPNWIRIQQLCRSGST